MSDIYRRGVDHRAGAGGIKCRCCGGSRKARQAIYRAEKRYQRQQQRKETQILWDEYLTEREDG